MVDHKALIDLGVDHFSFCIELIDSDWFARICPGKARTLGQALFFQAMEHCAARLPRGAVSGEIIAGLEPIENTIEGIERIVSAGAFPTVCIFRPTIGADLELWPPPKYDNMRTVMAAMYDTCRRHNLPIGLAPNIEVSLVVSPDDAALLSPRTASFYRYELWRRALPPETHHTTSASWEVDERTLVELYLIWFHTGVLDMIKEVDESLHMILTDVMEEMLEEHGWSRRRVVPHGGHDVQIYRATFKPMRHALTGRDATHRGRYVWRDGRDGGPMPDAGSRLT